MSDYGDDDDDDDDDELLVGVYACALTLVIY